MAKVFFLANEEFFDFRESFLREIRPKNYYSRTFLSSRFFDLAKVSAPTLIAKIDTTSNSETFSLKNSLANFIFII